MMYGSLDDLIRMFGKTQMAILSVADNELPDEPVAGPRIDGALEAATAMVNSYIGKRYRVPVSVSSPAMPAIIEAACIIAHFRLCHGGDRTPSEDQRKAYEDMIDWLKRISDGKADLNAPEVGGSSAHSPFTKDRPPMFSDKNLKGW